MLKTASHDQARDLIGLMSRHVEISQRFLVTRFKRDLAFRERVRDQEVFL
jgi:hypothetical protein